MISKSDNYFNWYNCVTTCVTTCQRHVLSKQSVATCRAGRYLSNICLHLISNTVSVGQEAYIRQGPLGRLLLTIKHFQNGMSCCGICLVLSSQYEYSPSSTQIKFSVFIISKSPFHWIHRGLCGVQQLILLPWMPHFKGTLLNKPVHYVIQNIWKWFKYLTIKS